MSKPIILNIQKPVVIIIILVLALSWPVVFQGGIPFRYDWSWPFFDTSIFWVELLKRTNSPFDFISIFAGIFLAVLGTLSVTPEVAFALFVFIIHLLSAYGFFLFISKKVDQSTAVVSSLVYAFTPYIFIRTIVGYRWSLIAYAALPYLLYLIFNFTPKKINYLLSGILLALVFSQVQAGVLVTLLISCHILTVPKKERVIVFKQTAISYLVFVIITLPWFIRSLKYESNLLAVSQNAVTTLQYISELPHRFRNLAILADHQITDNFFSILTREPVFLAGIALLYFVVLFGIFSKSNRRMKVAFLLTALLIVPFVKGPLGVFGSLYKVVFENFSLIRLFRETYHFQFILAFVVTCLFAFGLDKLLALVSSKVRPAFFAAGLKAFFAGSSLFLIAPYLTFDYAGYLSPIKVPSEYKSLYTYIQESKEICNKAYYPQGIGFLYFINEKSEIKDASNVDEIARSLTIPYLDDGTTFSYLPTEERFYRNQVVSQFLESSDEGQFVELLREGSIDCVIVRTDVDTRYFQASNLNKEHDTNILGKWNNSDMLELARSKEGLTLIKQFGGKIFIFKTQNPDSAAERSAKLINDQKEKIGNSAVEQWNNETIALLPLTDWATTYAYYKDGWSRGRYDFWRKHIFTQLRQDFIYTDKSGSVLSGKIDERGTYEVWTRYLTGGTYGNFQLSIINFQFEIVKDTGEEKFVWKRLGEVELNGESEFSIRNVAGENALADVVLLKR